MSSSYTTYKLKRITNVSNVNIIIRVRWRAKRRQITIVVWVKRQNQPFRMDLLLLINIIAVVPHQREAVVCKNHTTPKGRGQFEWIYCPAFHNQFSVGENNVRTKASIGPILTEARKNTKCIYMYATHIDELSERNIDKSIFNNNILF